LIFSNGPEEPTTVPLYIVSLPPSGYPITTVTSCPVESKGPLSAPSALSLFLVAIVTPQFQKLDCDARTGWNARKKRSENDTVAGHRLCFRQQCNPYAAMPSDRSTAA
jgi:hypothetical protein